jgi:RNA methyltransferase, TrmH family
VKPLPTIKLIQSRDNPLLLGLRKLMRQPTAYRQMGEVLLEGDHLCSAYLQQGGAPPTSALISETAFEQKAHLHQLALNATQVMVLPPALMASISSMESAPAIAFVIKPFLNLSIQAHVPTVVLDRLQDPGNVGTILRSSAVFGFTQVLALSGTAALWSPKVLRSAVGAHFGLHLIEDLKLQDLGALNVPLLATSSHAVKALHETHLPWPCTWVFGHEGQGIEPALLARCDQSLRIAQPGGEESLNVASAAAICLYESSRLASIEN